MRHWDKTAADVEKVTPDRERAKSLLSLVELREKDLRSKEKSDEFSALVVEAYYEMVKELLAALMSVGGYKTPSHEVLVSYMENYKNGISTAEIFLADQLRKTGNDIAYRGIAIPPDYLVRNREKIIALIKKLKKLVSSKLREKA
jgi:hypothetical protein